MMKWSLMRYYIGLLCQFEGRRAYNRDSARERRRERREKKQVGKQEQKCKGQPTIRINKENNDRWMHQTRRERLYVYRRCNWEKRRDGLAEQVFFSILIDVYFTFSLSSNRYGLHRHNIWLVIDQNIWEDIGRNRVWRTWETMCGRRGEKKWSDHISPKKGSIDISIHQNETNYASIDSFDDQRQRSPLSLCSEVYYTHIRQVKTKYAHCTSLDVTNNHEIIEGWKINTALLVISLYSRTLIRRDADTRSRR